MEENMTAQAAKRWYVVHAYSGFEKSVSRALEDRINRAGMKDKFGKILVPVEEVVEMKGGQKHMSERKFFPGYVLVEMEMNDDTWHLVKNTNKVTGFVGGTPHQARPDPREGGRGDHAADARGRGEAQAQGAVRGRRNGAGEGRPVHRLPGHGGRGELGEEPVARRGQDFWSFHSRGVGVWPSREGVVNRGGHRKSGARLNPQGEKHGEEDCRFDQAAGARGQGEPLATDRPGARSARPQHHGVLQGVQRADA